MSFEAEIKRIKRAITKAESSALSIVKDEKKKDKLIERIGLLKAQIDLLERADSNGNVHAGDLEKDVLEHLGKLKKAKEAVQNVLPFGWEGMVDKCSNTPLEESKLKELNKQLLQLETEHEALEKITKLFATTAENSQTSQEEVLTEARSAINTYNDFIKKVETYSKNNLQSTPDKKKEPKKEVPKDKEPKQEAPKEKKEEKGLVIHNGHYELIPKIEGEIKLSTGKVIPIKIEKLNAKKQFTIPQNTEGEMELKVFLAFKFNNLETTYTHTKNISASIKSDSNGKVAFISMAHNETTSSKNLLDILVAETVKVIKKQEDKFNNKYDVPKKHKIPEKAFYDFINKQVKQQLMTTSIQATHGEKSPVINVAYKLTTSDLDVSMNATIDAGVTFPFEATIEGGVGIGANIKGTENSGGVELVLLAAEERLDIDDELTIKFNKEKEITLDETDKKQLDVWWTEIQRDLREAIEKEESSKESNKGISKDKLQRKVERKLNKLLSTPNAYTIKITGFASTTGGGTENKNISNQRADSIKKYLTKTLHVTGDIRFGKPDGKDTCLKSNEDNKPVAECRKATVYFLTN